MALCRELLVSSCPARFSVHRVVLSAALSACQAVASAWLAVLSDCPATLPICRAVPSAELSACQAVSSGCRCVPSDCPVTLSVCRAVPSAELSAWRAVLSACQAAPWFSLFSPVPPLENWSVLQEKPMRVRWLANVISISSNSLGMVAFTIGVRRLEEQDCDQNQQGWW